MRTIWILTALLLSTDALAGGGSPCDGDWCPPCPCEGGDGVLLITPAGNGPTLGEQNLSVIVTLVDCGGAPLANLPAELAALQPPVGVSFCVPPAADAPSAANGTFTFSDTIAGGGWSEAIDGATVTVGGIPQLSRPLRFVSPDLTGDLRVDVADVGTFAADFANETYDFRSDLQHDGVENLGDISTLALHLGEHCD